MSISPLQALPDPLREIAERLSSPCLLAALGVISALTFVASVVGIPFFFARLPHDYFSRREQDQLGLAPRPPQSWRLALTILRNALGVVLVMLGTLMLFLPGQGLLTIAVGMMLVDFPGKRRFERWIIGRPSVLRTINRLRERAHQPPLEPRESWMPPPPKEPP